MMKRTGLLAFLVATSACGVFGSDSEPSSAAPPPAPQADAEAPPVADPIQGKPTNEELTEAHGVFVTMTGSDAGDGSRQHPVATLAKGISLGKANGKRVYVCAGTYPEALVLEDGVPMAGGLDCTNPAEWKSATDARSVVKSPSSPAATAKAITKPTRLDHIEIVAPDATTPSGSSIGLLAVDAGGLELVDSKVVAGKGMKGADGVNGAPLVPSGNAAGNSAAEKFVTPPNVFAPAGVAGGTNACDGQLNRVAGGGGAGGSPGVYLARQRISKIDGSIINEWYAEPGSAATPGVKRSGANGRDGAVGASAAAWGSIGEMGFAAADGTQGEDGLPGEGGSGGDGLAPDYAPQGHLGQYMRGYGGAGGGAGGCPGLAGTPGKGGGASIAVIAIRSALSFTASEIVAADGGAGGKGSYGTDPTPGGLPGDKTAEVTAAAPGGYGGQSGTSGSGAGGPSIAIAHAGGEPTTTTSKLTIGAAGAGVGQLDLQTKHIAPSANGVAVSTLKLD